MSKREVTAADVLRETIEFLSKPGHFRTDTFAMDARGKHVSPARDDVVQTCAIGGVEHAIYRLCAARGLAHSRERIARKTNPAKPKRASKALLLYWEVMTLLNKTAASTYPLDGSTIETLTFHKPLRSVLAVFRRALAKAEA